MDIFIKVTAGILITAIITVAVSKQSADVSLLLTILVSCMAILAVSSYLRPVIDFLERLVKIGQIENEVFSILLKTAGIGFISQIATMICSDAGNQSLSKTLQFVTTIVILCICVPLLDRILVLIETVLGNL